MLEVKIGYDGIVIAQSIQGAAFALTRRELFLALGRDIPGPDGFLQPNPNKKWRDVNPAFPDTAILVYGPPPTSGTRDAFAELVLEKGCARFSQLRSLKKSDKKKYKVICHSVREDGAYIEVGENDNIIIQKLVSNPDTLGVLDLVFWMKTATRCAALRWKGNCRNLTPSPTAVIWCPARCSFMLSCNITAKRRICKILWSFLFGRKSWVKMVF